jgi:predicted nucleotidyltransferase
MSVDIMLEIRRLEREQLLERIAVMLKSDPRIVAAWLFGSLGDGSADSLSDIDLWIVVADEYVEEMSAARSEYVARIGHPLLIQEAPQNAPAGGAYLLVLYHGDAGPQQVDWYWQARSRAQIPNGVRLLFDRIGLGDAPTGKPITPEERANDMTNQVAFFWSMSNIAAKKIARGQDWGAISMLILLTRTTEEIEWLIGLRDQRPGYKDTSTELAPVKPVDQMAILKGMAKRVEKLGPQINALGGTVPSEATLEIYRFFNLVDGILAGEARVGK